MNFSIDTFWPYINSPNPDFFLRLDLSDNAIDAEMNGVMHGIARNKSLVSLNVSRNMTGIKPKYLPSVMEAVVQLLQVGTSADTKKLFNILVFFRKMIFRNYRKKVYKL